MGVRSPSGSLVLAALTVGCAPPAPSAPRPAPTVLAIGGAAIELELADGPLAVGPDAIRAWVTAGAQATTAYFGRFPVDRFRVVVVPAPGAAGVLSGTTWAAGGAHARMIVGEHTTIAALDRDWVMTHEMIHTAFPDQPPAHHWIEEGLATYAEPLARSWVGRYPPAQVWADLVDGLPQGLPRSGDRGLDHTPTWGRTYWGGALFCLLADVELRARTGGARGLVDALRGVVAAGGNDQADWSLAETLAVADRAVGVPVLSELYARMKDAPVAPDLEALWRELGVGRGDDGVVLDDAAPRAAIRRAISAPPR